MKKIKILGIGLALLFAVACNKEEISTTETYNVSKLTSHNKSSGKEGEDKPKRRMFWDEPMLPTGCVPKEVDCFPFDIVITPNNNVKINELFRVIDGGIQNTIQAEFQIKKDFLVDLMSTGMSRQEAAQMVEEVINETLIASTIYDDEDNQKFILLHQQEIDDPYFVLPFNE